MEPGKVADALTWGKVALPLETDILLPKMDSLPTSLYSEGKRRIRLQEHFNTHGR
jgi:hypothetical protein